MTVAYVSARDPRVSALFSSRKSPAGTLVAEGMWAHRSLLDLGADIETFAHCPDLLAPDARELAAACARRARHAVAVSAKTFARIARRNRADGLASLVRLPRWTADETSIGGRRVDSGTLVLVADGIEYAVNLGALLRVADARGAQAVILTSRRARIESPEVFTASRGTVLTVPVVDFGPPERAVDWLARLGFAVYVAMPGAPVDHRDRPHGTGPAAIVVGSEGGGVAPEWRDPRHTPVSIPMRGRADSLNVAVAAGILLFG